MDSTYVGNENDEKDAKEKEMVNMENSNTVRSYDCAFCKRGFTNAQALGGHMNIHRKDKAKAKKLSESTSAAHKSCEYFAPITSEQAQFYASLRENNSYQMLSASPNVNYPHAFTPQGVSSHDLSTSYRDFMNSNLSLRIGLPTMEESKEELKKENHEDTSRFENDPVDLELRLGHNP